MILVYKKKGYNPWNKGKKLSEKIRKNMSIGRKNHIKKYGFTEEHRKNISLGRKGIKPSALAIQRSVEARMGKPSWNKGIPMTDITKTKLSKANKGKKPWNKDKTGIYSEETRRRMSESRIGIKVSEKTKKKLRDKRLHQVFPPKDNKFETWWFQRLKEKGIEFEKHKPILGQPDIFIKPNLCIFLDGDRHHANPSKYSDDAIIWKERISKTGRHTPAITAKMIHEKDERIRQELITDGYKIISAWYSDWKKDPEKYLQKIIKVIKESGQ